MATVEASLRADALADDVQQRLLIERHGNLRSREARALMIAKLHHNRKWFDSGEYFLTKEGKLIQDVLPGGESVETLPPKLSKTSAWKMRSPPPPAVVAPTGMHVPVANVSDY
uniref:Uncharacterized protein n=1 Tax=Chlamydomonas euryale TaxID=1486919 RepID=A0A7R9VG56_9CHLO|mmetsp:Transcript_34148/g.101513  ORF Transcript_34148/g.101513 Transcript_34148/m.101513 type:complete len:113 (+) Transcript_34148:384-722(+)